VNAFFTGVGKTVSVVLYDNLLNKFTKREVRTVIGHELGHYVHKDIIRYTVIGGVQTVIVFFLADLLARRLFLNNTQGYLPLYVMPVISGIIAVLEFIALPIMMSYSRKQEKAADIFALDYVKDPLAQISTEKKLADLDLGDENPHPLVEFWLHSHPSPEKRVKYTKEWMKLSKVKG
jgi:STE24 endopeptidase